MSLALNQVNPLAGICLLKVKQVRINKEVALKVTFELPVQGAVGWLLRCFQLVDLILQVDQLVDVPDELVWVSGRGHVVELLM